MSYEDKIGCYIETNWSMGRNDVIDGACSWAEEADKEITKLKAINFNGELIIGSYKEQVKSLDKELEANKKKLTEFDQLIAKSKSIARKLSPDQSVAILATAEQFKKLLTKEDRE